MKRIFFYLTIVSFLFLEACLPSLHPIVDDETRIIDDRLLGNWTLPYDSFLDNNPVVKLNDIKVHTDDTDEDIESIKENMVNFIDSLNAANNPEATSFWKFERAVSIIAKFDKKDKKSNAKHLDLEIKLPTGTLSDLELFKKKFGKPSELEMKNYDYYFLTYSSLETTMEKEPQRIKVELTEIDGDLYLDFLPTSSEKGYSRFSDNFLVGHTFARVHFKEGIITIEPFNGNYIESLIKEKKVRLKHEILKKINPYYNENTKLYELDEQDQIVLTASTRELRSFIEKYGKDSRLYDGKEILEPITP